MTFLNSGIGLLKSGICSSGSEFDELFLELNRYLELCFRTGASLQMPNKRIDLVWHEFILFTLDYDRFCNDSFGTFIHHTPSNPSQVENDSTSDFADLYE